MTSDISRGGRDSTAQAKDQVQQKAAEVKDQVQQKAAEVKDQVQEQVASRIAVQKDSAASSLSGVAQALRQTGQQLRSQDQAGVTDYMDQAADQVERLAGYLQGSDLGRLVGDVERFARRQPALFLGGAFLAGLIGARFLKSSRPDEPAGMGFRGTPGYGYQGVYGSGMGGAYTPGYGTPGVYDSPRPTNYGTGEIPGVYRPSETGRPASAEPRARTYGEPLEE